MTYLNVEEVESALEVAAAPPNHQFTELIGLPQRTWEGRECHAIKLARGSSPGRIAVYLISGVHAREWGGSDILIFFVEQVIQAYRTNTGLSLGSKSFSAAQIQEILNTIDIFVFPQVNPDGRYFSMTATDTDGECWRKNRRPSPNSNPNCTGVDINRNYDFLWNFPEYFTSSDAPLESSINPCSNNYIGPSAVSEPETQNVVSLLDSYPHIRYFVDVHTFGELVLFPWGDDSDQSTDTAMNFRNAKYKSVRGIVRESPGADAYKEYIDAGDLAHMRAVAVEVCQAIEAVGGRVYRALPAAEGLAYVTSGTSRDYTFSRHLQQPNREKMYSFTIESGSEDYPDHFHPPYDEYMRPIIREVTAGLVEFCARVVPRISFKPAKISFGQIVAGDTKVKRLTLQNGSSVPVTVSSPGSGRGTFSWLSLNAVIPPKGSTDMLVRFFPKSAGKYSATLTVTSSAAGSPHSIKLSGAAIGGPIP